MWICCCKDWSYIAVHYTLFRQTSYIRGPSKHLSYLDFKKAAIIVKNKGDLNADKRGLEEILQLKKRITSLYSNNSINNHRIEQGTEKLDQKR